MRTVLRISLVGLLFAAPAQAQWTSDPTANTPAVVAPGTQTPLVGIADGAGGAFFTWWDDRNSATSGIDIWAQHLTARGFRDWGPGGVPIDQRSGDQYVVGIVPALDGGVFIATSDQDASSPPIVQRMSPGGVPLWGPGVPVSNLAGDHINARLITAPGGDVFVSWSMVGALHSVMVQRLDPAGNRLWGDAGVSVCNSLIPQAQRFVADGSGGLLIGWQDYRFFDGNVFAQRVDGAGNVLWTTNGVRVAPSDTEQALLTVGSDAAGGMILGWLDYRGGVKRIFAQRVDGSGSSLWGPTGTPACTTLSSQFGPSLRTDAAGYSYFTWEDTRSGNTDIYAQRLDPFGTRTWGEAGAAVCTLPGSQSPGLPALDDQGGLFVCWSQAGVSGRDVFAQHVLANGTNTWPASGLVISSAIGDQVSPSLLQDGAGGAIAFWSDRRSDDGDLYVEHLLADGTLGPTVGVEPSPLPRTFALARTGHHPVLSGAAGFRLDLPAASRVDLFVTDVQGRRVGVLAQGTWTAGSHAISWNLRDASGARVPPGVYLAVARAGGLQSVVRFIVVS